jgi:hypothetical protein
MADAADIAMKSRREQSIELDRRGIIVLALFIYRTTSLVELGKNSVGRLAIL